jgi:hypothetical protein
LGRKPVVKSNCKEAGAGMTISNIAFADGISRAAFYHCDPTDLPEVVTNPHEVVRLEC